MPSHFSRFSRFSSPSGNPDVAGFLPQERPAQLKAIECPPCRDETPRQDTPSEESKPKYQLLQTAVNTNINDPTCNTLSGTDIGLQNIMTNRSPAESSTDSSVEDSSGEQTFWREIVSCVSYGKIKQWNCERNKFNSLFWSLFHSGVRF